MSDLLKHAGEFRRAMETHQYERTDEGGLYFPKAKVVAAGMYVHDVNGQDERQDPNILPDEGLLYLLSVGVNNGTKVTAWYLSLYAGNYTPVAGLTAASYPATAGEITSNSEGYTESTRRAWSIATPAANIADNLASKAAFTIATASSLTVNGAGLSSISTKGAITGTLLSATKFASTRTLYDTDVFKLGYRVQLTSS